MTRVIEFLIALVIVVVLFLVVGVFLPSRRHVEHSVETNHPVRQVYDTLEEQIGFETTRGDASRPWLVLGVVFATAGLTIALVRRQRLP